MYIHNNSYKINATNQGNNVIIDGVHIINECTVLSHSGGLKIYSSDEIQNQESINSLLK